MRICLIFWLFFSILESQAQVFQTPVVIKGNRTAITGPLHNWTPDFSDPSLRIKTRDERGLIFARDLDPLRFTNYGSNYGGPDPVWQKGVGQGGPVNIQKNTGTRMMPVPGQSLEIDAATIDKTFEGLASSNIAPGDPTLAIGPNHIIQMVNGTNGSAFFRIFTRDGLALTTQAFMDQLPGTSYNGAGDCITWYDQLTDRFVMSEFGDSSKTGADVNSLIIAVSAGPDPRGSWFVYEFSDASFFPDYPKYGNWPDVWYGMTRDFEGAYAGNSVWAFNKNQMIAGEATVDVQRIRLTNPDNIYNTLCPVTLAGSALPPAGTPGYFLYYNDDNFTSSPADTDSLGIVSLKVDFNNPAKTVVRIEASLPVQPFRSNVCDSRNCAPSPNGNGYDVISTRIMNRPYYRNFGTYQAIVANHTVDVTGTFVSGIRWYELRTSNSDWQVYQQSSFGPQTDIACVSTPVMHRFMAAITLSANGQIAMGYNSSSSARYASIGITGRNAEDPLNLMSYQEKDAVVGTGYGTFGNRWGDYNEIVPDLLDDSLFWFTGMYGSGANTWKTKIFSFKLAPAPRLDARLVSIEYPNVCESFCNTSVEPRIKIKNLGSETLQSLKVYFQVNNGSPVQSVWTGTLAVSEETEYTLPMVNLPAGSSNIRVYISEPNNGSDENRANDTSRVRVTAGLSVALPLTEGFESTVFPPNLWSISGTGSSTLYPTRVTDASHSGAASVRFDNFNTNEPGKWSELRSPLLTVTGSDSLSLSFWYAAAVFDQNSVDTFEIRVSDDCGQSYTTVWKKWGTELATRPGDFNNDYIPNAADWKNITINLKDFTSQDKIIIAFRNTNNFGNNIYLDDINVSSYRFPFLDAAIVKISEPLPYVCDNDIQPLIRFTNLGKDTLRSLSFSYRIDAAPPTVFTWTGTLARLQGGVAILPVAAVSTGSRLLEVFVSNPNGKDDENPANDTSRLDFIVKQPITLPITENFEFSAFPPDQWNNNNPDGQVGWQRTTLAARNGTASMFMNNYNYRTLNQPDEFVTPLLTYSGVDSVYLAFQLAASTFSYPGSTEVPLDTLEILVSTDCGRNFIPVYKKWGDSLQTLGNRNAPNTLEFIPDGPSKWRQEIINLTPLLGQSNSFLAMIRNTSNGENNIFIDDINLYTKILPVKLKNNGYLVSPNPFRNRLVVQFYPDAGALKAMEVYNAAGQVVYRRTFPQGSASATQDINLTNLPAGMYTLRIVQTDKVTTEKVIKIN
jgi:hypothetical protein